MPTPTPAPGPTPSADTPPAPTATPAATTSPRQRLLDAAEELFYGQGIRATGVEAVLARAGVARNTLYHQFGGKAGLVVAYLRRRDERWHAHWEATIAERDGPVDRFLAILDALGSWAADGQLARGCAFLDAQIELADPTHPAATVIADHWRGLEARLHELAVAADLTPPERVTRDLLLLYRGALVASLREPVDEVVAHATGLATALTARHGAHGR